jgi:hypothetical protein
MAENLGALAVDLTPAQLERLDEISAIDLGFPREFLLTSRRATYGESLGKIRDHRAELEMPPELVRAARTDADAHAGGA